MSVPVNATTLADLKLDPKNARLHTMRSTGAIVNGLHEVGAARSIVIDENNVILAGNNTVTAAAEAGIEKVHVVEADGETIIAVRRTGLTDRQKQRLALIDNRASDLSAFDMTVLAELLQEDGDILAGLWYQSELDELLRDLPPVEEAEVTEVAGLPEARDPLTLTGETVQDRQCLQFAGLKIPVTEEEASSLKQELADYREEFGAYDGFINYLLGGDAIKPDA